MLIEFSIKNFKIFKDLNTISLVASNYDKSRLEDNTFLNRKNHVRLLKSAVLYGANASGKSKFFEAFGAFRDFALNSSKDSQADENIEIIPFLLDARTEKEPTSFEIILQATGIRYRYGFEVNKTKVLKEWLYTKDTGNEAEFFYRRNNKFSTGNESEVADELISKKMVRDNALFISVLAQFNDKTAKKLLSVLRAINLISGLKHEGYEGFTVQQIENEKKIPKEDILDFLNVADFGIEDLKIDRINVDNLPDDMPETLKEFIKKNKKDVNLYQDITAFRKRYNNGELTSDTVPFSMRDDESSGTRKYFALSGPILDTLKNGTTLFIDEIDSQLHPRLVEHLIHLFNSKANSKNAQLILNTHDVNLLQTSIFRRDQIWFTEKDKFGVARLYSLAEIKTEENKKIRNDENYERNYLQGKYGAVPYINNIEFVK